MTPKPFSSKKQKAVYEFIVEYTKTHSMPPTYQEIADHFNNAISTIHVHVTNLAYLGWVKANPDVSRGIRVLKDGKFCPCCGAVI